VNKDVNVNTTLMDIKQIFKYSELSRILTKNINKIEKKVMVYILHRQKQLIQILNI